MDIQQLALEYANEQMQLVSNSQIVFKESVESFWWAQIRRAYEAGYQMGKVDATRKESKDENG